MAEVGERRRTLLVLALVGAQVGVVAALLAGLGRTHLADGPTAALPWWSVAVLFALTESAVLHVQWRREAQTVSISELPLVLGLFLAAPWALLVGRAVGSFLIFAVYRRSSPLKTCFNTVLVTMETSVALAVFALVSVDASAGAPRSWVAALVAALVANATGATALGLVIAIHEGGTSLRHLLRHILAGQAAAPGVVVLALVAVDVAAPGGWNGWLVAAAGIVVVVCYRVYASLYDRHVNLERLYSFSQAVTESAESDRVLELVLSGASELLAGGTSELVIVPRAGSTGLVHVTLGEEGRVVRRHRDPAAEDAWVRDHVLAHGSSLVLPRRSRDPRTRAWLTSRGVRDAVVVPLRGTDHILGMLAVCDRLGEVRSFDGQDVLLLETLANHASVSLEKSELAGQLEHDALHDLLTGLPNRAHLQRHLVQALEEDRRAGDRLAVLMLDLDGFKDVNDSLGHSAGDRVLVEVATRLTDTVAGLGFVARLGGDEFAAVVPTTTGAGAALALSQRIVAALQQPMSLDGLHFEVGASLGVALSPDHGTAAAVLMKRADLAMHEAKSSGLRTCVFELTQDSTSARRLELVGALRQALNDGELQIVVQPQVDAASLAPVAVEALARWTHPTLGVISPAEFIPVAERSGLIGPLTMEVLGAALGAHAQWRQRGVDVTVAVNLSPRSLLDPSLVDDVASALERAGVAPSSLVLEVTEGAVMTDPDRAIELLSRFEAMGVRLSIDDFGTGYSSLSYLKRLPVHEVKVDRSFVTGLATNEEDRAIVRSIIGLADNLGLEVVAEGVENGEAFDILAAMGCTRVQGWHLARPMTVEAATQWLTERSPALAG